MPWQCIVWFGFKLRTWTLHFLFARYILDNFTVYCQELRRNCFVSEQTTTHTIVIMLYKTYVMIITRLRVLGRRYLLHPAFPKMMMDWNAGRRVGRHTWWRQYSCSTLEYSNIRRWPPSIAEGAEALIQQTDLHNWITGVWNPICSGMSRKGIVCYHSNVCGDLPILVHPRVQ